MIWKIFFIITALLLLITNILGYNIGYTGMSNIEYLAGIYISVCIAFILGLFYALGLKQQIFSKKLIKIFATVFITSIILFLFINTLCTYPFIYWELKSRSLAVIGCIISFAMMFVFTNLFLIPFYIGLYKYNKNFDDFRRAEKPYWKVFSIYCITVFASFILAALIRFTHLLSYNPADYFIIISCIYEILFLIGFAWNKRIFNKLFWQITAAPYIILTITAPFFISDTFNRDFAFKNMILGNYASIIFTVLTYIAFIYIICRYAYSKEESAES